MDWELLEARDSIFFVVVQHGAPVPSTEQST